MVNEIDPASALTPPMARAKVLEEAREKGRMFANRGMARDPAPFATEEARAAFRSGYDEGVTPDGIENKPWASNQYGSKK